MTAIKADAYFAQNQKLAGEAKEAPVIEARRVAPGDTMTIGKGLMFMVRAEQPGWVIEFGGGCKFFNTAEFESVFAPEVDNPTKELPEGTKVERVFKDDQIVTFPFSDIDVGVQGKADCDGFLITPKDSHKSVFLSEAFYRATYKNDLPPVAHNPDQGRFRYIAQADEPSFRFVVLTKDVEFDFKAGPYKAAMGSVLVENPADEDGYTLLTGERFAQTYSVTKMASAPAVSFRPKGPKR